MKFSQYLYDGKHVTEAKKWIRKGKPNPLDKKGTGELPKEEE